jgi:hypothetical protein
VHSARCLACTCASSAPHRFHPVHGTTHSLCLPALIFVRSKSEGFPGAWLEATVVSVGDDRDVTVEYAKMRQTEAEDSPFLRETVKVKRYATVSAASGEHGPCGGTPGGCLESGLLSRGSTICVCCCWRERHSLLPRLSPHAAAAQAVRMPVGTSCAVSTLTRVLLVPPKAASYSDDR